MKHADSQAPAPATFLGHPPGLFLLFFVEMWERFSFYGMKALLVFYMIKGFLKYDDAKAYAVLGAYGALVYATPYLGGILADRLLGARRAVVFGGLLMAAGHLLMTVETKEAFFLALSLLICGNGFFKPNISTMVGRLYPAGSPKRDGGFTLFYMGINLGAAMAPLVCGYVGETYGWHYGFGLATIGMLVGLATFVAPAGGARLLIALTTLVTAGSMFWIVRDQTVMLVVNTPVGLALVAAGAVAVAALGAGSLPAEAGAPAEPRKLSEPLFPGLAFPSKGMACYLITLAAVPVIALLVDRETVANWCLAALGALALAGILVEAARATRIERDRIVVILVLMFFTLLFWAFFEQAGSSVNNFTDRNVDRVVADTPLVEEDLGRTMTEVAITQEFLGRTIDGKLVDLAMVEAATTERATGTGPGTFPPFVVTEDLLGTGIGGTELKASVFQAVNPVYILVFGLLFTVLWGWLGARGIEPSTPVKFALGLAQLGLGFGAFWYGATVADGQGFVALQWLLVGYLLQTTGELCLSPVGLSMVTRLSPKRIVGTVMGAWFLATAFSHALAAQIAKLTSVGGDGEGGQVIPPPLETVAVYGKVFGQIAFLAIGAGLLLLILAPWLNRLTHADEETN